MRELNIDFMDLYKSVDRFLKDAYSSDTGVTNYIQNMELKFLQGRRSISSWQSDYDELKHLRWIRNQLAHDVDYDSDICEEKDYYWLEGFRDRLFSAEDPMAKLIRAEETIKHQQVKPVQKPLSPLYKQFNNKSSEPAPPIQYNHYPYTPKESIKPKHRSFWQWLKDLFT